MPFLRRGLTTVGAICSVLGAVADERPTSSIKLHYDVQVAWIQAGEIVMQLTEDGDRYALYGTVTTSSFMDRFFTWHGQFVADGRFRDNFPHTDAYMLWGDDGQREETLVSFGGRTSVTTSDGESYELDQPPGSDFMSVTFLAPHCLNGASLHDGEDLYFVQLVRAADDPLTLRPPFYAGASQRCDYQFRYTDGNTRRVSLWVAEWQGRRLPVRVRVRIPLLPDGVMHLRLDRK